jgi:hypothetical protein
LINIAIIFLLKRKVGLTVGTERDEGVARVTSRARVEREDGRCCHFSRLLNRSRAYDGVPGDEDDEERRETSTNGDLRKLSRRVLRSAAARCNDSTWCNMLRDACRDGLRTLRPSGERGGRLGRRDERSLDVAEALNADRAERAARLAASC